MTVECPTCGDEFDSETGMKIHHATVHDESLAGVEVNCSYCGDKLQRKEYLIEQCENHFCDSDCEGAWKSENRSGEDHPNYKKISTECEICGDEYRIPPSKDDRNRFCSRECMLRWMSNRMSGDQNDLWKEPVTLRCEYCGEHYTVAPSEAERSRFCSRQCHGKFRGENISDSVDLTCERCGSTYSVVRSRQDISRFCSKECFDGYRSDNPRTGKDHPRWNGGKPRYYGENWHRKRREAMKRDGGRCVQCEMSREDHKKEYDEDLHVHHLKPIATFDSPEDANYLENLVTLCRDHHSEWEQLAPLRPDTAAATT